jgi:hypothetical protein
MPRATFFTIDVEDAPRVLFSVQRRGSGDLTIIIKHGTHITPHDTFAVPDPGFTIIEQRISIHLSPQSLDINALKSTTITKDGRRIIARNYTKAIKSGHRFAPLYMERCRDLTATRYILKYANAPQVSLGRYSPKLFQLVYQIFVGSARSEFRTYCKHDINVTQVVIGQLRIIVIWSFFGIPSDSTGNYTSFQTRTAEEIQAHEDADLRSFLTDFADGYDENTCVEAFRVYRLNILEQYLGRLDTAPGEEKNLVPKIRKFIGFFRYPSPDSAEFIDHFRRYELLPPDERIPQKNG